MYEGRAVDVIYLWQDFLCGLPYHHSDNIQQIDELQTKWMASEMYCKMAELPGSKGCNQWHEAQLEASH